MTLKERASQIAAFAKSVGEPQANPGEWTRRGLLLDLGLAAGSLIIATFLEGCASPPTPTIAPSKAPNKDFLPGIARLLLEVDALPDSYTKTLLISRIKPYMTTNPPFRVSRDGDKLKYEINKVTVNRGMTEVPGVNGQFNLGAGESELVKPKTPSTFNVPLLKQLLKADEQQRLSAQYRFPDGIPYSKVVISPEKSLPRSFAIAISVLEGDKSKNPKLAKFLDAAASFAYRKEAYSMLLWDLLLERTYKMMEDKGIKTEIDVEGSKGIEKLNITNHVLLSVLNNSGRYLAVLDEGGYLLTLRATGKEELDMLKEDKSLAGVIDILDTFDPGSTPDSVLENTISWVVNHPEAIKLQHKGDDKKLPDLLTPREMNTAIAMNDIFPVPNLQIA